MSHKPHFAPTGSQTGTKEDWSQDICDYLRKITGDKDFSLDSLTRMSHADLRTLAMLLADVPAKV